MRALRMERPAGRMTKSGVSVIGRNGRDGPQRESPRDWSAHERSVPPALHANRGEGRARRSRDRSAESPVESAPERRRIRTRAHAPLRSRGSSVSLRSPTSLYTNATHFRHQKKALRRLGPGGSSARSRPPSDRRIGAWRIAKRRANHVCRVRAWCAVLTGGIRSTAWLASRSRRRFGEERRIQLGLATWEEIVHRRSERPLGPGQVVHFDPPERRGAHLGPAGPDPPGQN